ncbi:hypothetical protein CL658_00570 [bacterium]|nr:hypothetical protein [bacterium]|tara:strand:+ start:241 stop:1293 length:1053 start_codon:yes stop_codon:yes gene_type:complete
MFIISLMNQLILFFVLLFTSVSFGNQISLNLISPKTDFRSSKDLVLFKGTVTHASSVFINDTPVPIFKNRFYIKAILNPHQENTFVIKAMANDKQTISITRSIDYFPETPSSRIAPYSISDIQFQPLSHQWKIKGLASHSKHIYINGKHIPIKANGLFEYHFSQQALDQSYLNLSGISKDLLLFHHTLGLQEVNHKTPSHVSSDKKIHYLSMELGILQAYYNMHWQLIPFTTIQEKMIHDLVQNKYTQLNLSHIKLLKKDHNLVIAIPYLYHSLPIPELSYQLLLILQNTIQASNHISILWYNKVPNVIEVVYNKNSTPYCIIDDKPVDLDQALVLGAFSEFKSNHFGIR